MNWVKCSERLPELGVKVLIATVDKDFWVAERNDWDGKEDCEWSWDHGFNDLEPDRVTHWMPLPEPP